MYEGRREGERERGRQKERGESGVLEKWKGRWSIARRGDQDGEKRKRIIRSESGEEVDGEWEASVGGCVWAASVGGCVGEWRRWVGLD